MPAQTAVHRVATGNRGTDDRYRATRRVSFVGAAVNMALSLAQVTFGVIGQSQALIVDGIHTLSDLLSDSIVLLAARLSHRGADEDHPYGYGRFETVATVALGLLLLLVAFGIAWDAGQRLMAPDRLLHPNAVAFAAAALGITAKEILFRYTRRVARQVRSKLLEANAWHHRSDALSSIVVFVGVGGTLLGFSSMDALAAVGVALMIAWIAADLIRSSVRELVDTALEPQTVSRIRELIRSVEGVEDLHVLRTRRLGPDVFVDVHIIVDSRLTVSEGHFISEKVRGRVIRALDEVTDVLVHIDPEDDETLEPPTDLPSREAMIQQLTDRWAAQAKIERINLHYLEGRVDVDVVLPLERLGREADVARLRAALEQSAAGLPRLGRIELYFH